jgi:methylmalonyl-CoA/ethylmalonyl-CoA epimerase
MELRYSHIHILVEDLDKTVEYFENILGFEAGSLQEFENDEMRVRYKVVKNEWQRFLLVQPGKGNLKDLLDERGNGTIHHFSWSTSDIEGVYRELVSKGVQPQDAFGGPVSEADLVSAEGPKYFFLPKDVGQLSMEVIQEPVPLPGE